MEIICISCWRAFDHDTSTAAAEVACPHCGFKQPGPDPSSLDAKLDANTRPTPAPSGESPAPEPEAVAPPAEPVAPPPPAAPVTPPPAAPVTPAPAAPIDPPKADLHSPNQSISQTADFASPPDVPPEEPSKPDHRWRLRTRALLVLFFPDYELSLIHI